ncbi:MAG TPA: phospholipase D family protein [Burkholderiales bacterium]|nr:phospholipase D family protein [Burkholderiales bacterium]
MQTMLITNFDGILRRALPWLAPLALAACVSLPAERTAAPSYALADTGGTTLGRYSAQARAGLQGPNGVHLMLRGQDAFLARLALAELAERSIDAQYYIWHKDQTGQLLVAALLRAADRGVRVRVLIDDVGSAANDMGLLALDGHPNVEVRLFNPLANRTARTFGMLFDFARTNRRMHNKSFTADNQFTIIGGRNIGDEYFEADSEVDFGDLDSLTIGAAVADVSGWFDRYWNSPSVYAIGELTTARPDAQASAQARASLHEFEITQRGLAYSQALRESALAEQLRAGKIPFTRADIRVLADDPAKVEQPDGDLSKNLRPQLMPEYSGLRERLVLVSPYFVPGDEGVASLRRLRERGVRVRVVTNSLASTDEPAVYAGYEKYQRPLLEAGIELYELSPAAEREDTRKQSRKRDEDNPHGSGRSRGALHAKVLLFDCRSFFVGSMNLDPRSAFTNTEIGFVVDAPGEAAQLCDMMDRNLPQNAYRLELSKPQPGGSAIEWVGLEGGREVRYASEPMTSAWQRFKSWFYSLLPIEPLL